MAEIPNPQSYEQLNSDMLSAYAAKLGINDFLVGSAVTSFFEVVALATARASGDIFQILRDFSVDRATGDALKRLARDNRVTPITARPATGYVTVTDSSFTKVSTKVYAGANPPNIGSTQIKVSDASAFTATGSIYIGRGTPNVEGPLAYTSITPTGGYYIINLAAPTTKFHNVGEAVILSQGGNRQVPANTIALSPSTGASPDIQFSVVTAAIILDGETTVENVQVTALIPGASTGNVPRGAIKQFSAPPFPGATVTNPLPFTNGADNETDDELRVRIKRALASIGLGTATVVKSAVIGATPVDEQATIVSDSLISSADGAILFIDDGSGYEAKTAGVGLESIVDSALGGEKFFQLATGGRQAPVAKAFLESVFAGPYDLMDGDTLAITVGETTYEHTFDNDDFRSPGGATAFEVTASINANTALGFEATTSGGGQYVVVRAKEEGNDSVKTATPTTNGRNAALLLGLPSNEIQTLRLYKNKIPLNKDGKSASVFTQNQQLWSNTIQDGDTLVLAVDGTASITYTFNDADFIATGLFNTVSSSNSLDAWVLVFNAKLTGVTASIVGQQIKITSNLGTDNRAQVVIDGSSTLVNKGMFSVLAGLSAQGKASDFTLDRNTAQFELTVALEEGDQLSAGSDQTEARIQSGIVPGGTVTLSGDGHTWILIDTSGVIINTGVTGNTLLTVTKPSANVVRYTSNVPSAFVNVLPGDYIIIWSTELSAPNRLEGRVNATTSTTIDILVTAAEYAAATPEANILYSEGFVVMRSTLAPQKFRVTSGTKSLDQIAIELQDQTNSLIFTVQEEQYLVVRSRTKDVDGKVLIVTSDFYGKLLNLPINTSDTSKDSLIAFYESQTVEGAFPLFIHAGFAAGTAADPIDSYITQFVSDTSFAGRDPNELISLLHPYGVVADAQPYHEVVQEEAVAATLVDIVNHPYLRRFRTVDRFFLASPLNFGNADTAVVILDNDPSGKAFEIPFFRRAITNTSLANNPSNFNAYDVDSGATADFDVAFNGFDFANFKVLLQAKKVLKHTPPETALLYRSARWGRSGEKINVGYIYPSSADQPINSAITVQEEVDLRITLKSGPAVPSSIDNTTEWNISITPNTPVAGVDQVTYTYSGTGTAPALNLSGGEYVNITSQTEFDPANDGIFRVSDEAGFLPTANSFSVQRPTGAAVAESNKATLVNGAISFYESDDTTAAEINTYVNANLSTYVTSTIVDDGGMSGSGIIATSTYEDSAFTYESVYLLDGINWIASSNLSGSPEFTFKVPLALDSDTGYEFNDGEEIRLVPTTMDQVRRFISVLAVTGFTTIGTVGVSDRGTKLELATSVLGSDGSIQVTGGAANQYELPVLDSAGRINNSLMNVSVDRVSSQYVQSDQWFKLQASYSQRKETLFSSNTSITVQNNTPLPAQTTVVMNSRAINQRYFGKPRHHVRSRNKTFRIEKQGSLVCLSWNGIGTSPDFIKNLLNFNDAGGGTLNVFKIIGSSEVEYRILSGNANFSELSIGDLLTITALPSAENNGTFLVTGVSDDGTTVRVLNPEASNEFSTATYTFSGNSTAGDIFSVDGNNLVAGTDFVIGATQQDTALNLATVIGSLSTVSASANGSVVTVTANNPSANIAISYTGTPVVTVSGAFLVGQSFNAATFNASSEVSEGDNLVLDAPFDVLNQGKFRVIRRYNNSVWYENANVIEEEVTLPDNLISLGFSGTTQFDVDASNHTILLSWNSVGTPPTLANAQMGDVVRFGTNFAVANRGDFMVIDSGSNYLECINPAAVDETGISITDVLQCHRPQMQFSEYEATIAGDRFVITGNILGANSNGTFDVVRTVNRNSIIIAASLTSVSNVSMLNKETFVYVEEDQPYSGYKMVSFVSQQPGAANRNLLVFDTNAQYSKINDSAAVQISSLNKMNFPTSVRQGLDSYRYNTGLIAEANRIIYGDPRDPATYPGVGAAGAEIFVREPLTRRIQVSIVIRTLTGIPFAQTVEQVRTSISSLINSNPVGESIAISAIISAVNAIPGIRAVSINSPQYDSTHDIIFIAPSEKARILDPSLDIFVSQVGS